MVTVARNVAAVIAERFLAARRAAAGLADYPGEMPSSLDGAYAIQDAAIAAWDRPIIGWKVGRVPAALISRFRAERLAGPIFSSQTHEASQGEIDLPVFEHGYAEGEAALLMR